MEIMINILSAATTTLAGVVAYLYKRDTDRSDRNFAELKLENTNCRKGRESDSKKLAILHTEFAVFKTANSVRCSAVDCPLNKNDPKKKQES